MVNLTLRFLTGSRRGQALSFDAPRVRIGRSRDNDLVIPAEDSPASSGHHAEAVRDGDKWWITDLESTNGTFVKGVRLPPERRERLNDGDEIGLGGPPLLVSTFSRRRRPFILVSLLILFLALVVSAVLLINWKLQRMDLGFELVAAEAAPSVYLVAIEDGEKRYAVGSAFAVDGEGLLATAAHVALALEKRGALLGAKKGGQAIALRTDTAAGALPIVEAWVHPEHEVGTLENDVALLRLNPGSSLASVRLASDADVARLRRGVRLAAFGFPAPGTDPYHPRGRLSEDVLGDIRAERYFEVGLGIVPGMSGAPVFTRQGKVVGIVVGGDFRADAVSSGVNWAISVTALREMLK